MTAIETLSGSIWVSTHRPPVTAELLTALTATGNYVATALASDKLIGVSVGWIAGDRPRILHSHLTGVHPSARGTGVGAALKHHQRAWARSQGLDAVEWTFDPLQAVNLRFNLNRLGAAGTAFMHDFYGRMRDGLNANDTSDRVLAHWTTDRCGYGASGGNRNDTSVDNATTHLGKLSRAGCILSSDGRGRPVTRDDAGPLLRALLPPHLLDLRHRNPQLLLEWRTAVRQTLGTALNNGYAATFVDNDGWLLLERPDLAV